MMGFIKRIVISKKGIIAIALGVFLAFLIFRLLGLSVIKPAESPAGNSNPESNRFKDMSEGISDLETPLFTFAVAGDSAGGDAIFGEIIAEVNKSNASFLIHNGDMVDHGYASEWSSFFKLKEKLKVPFHPVPGNHDVYNGRDQYVKQMGKLYYSFDYKNARFFLIDNARGKISSEQLKWLKDDLRKISSKMIFFVMHQAPKSSFSDHTMSGSSLNLEGAKEILALAKIYRVSAIFSGHVHGFFDETVDGVRTIISGGAGSPIFLPEFLGGIYHWLHVSVFPDRFSYEVKKLPY